MPNKNIQLAFLYFGLSTVLTLLFIILSPLYISQEQMFLSTSIAGGKWAVQILLAFLLIPNPWAFVKEIGFVCFIGSCLLVPYIALSVLNLSDAPALFIVSLVLAVLVMIYLYFKGMTKLKLSVYWFFVWLFCLSIAVTLQLTVVF